MSQGETFVPKMAIEKLLENSGISESGIDPILQTVSFNILAGILSTKSDHLAGFFSLFLEPCLLVSLKSLANLE